MIPLRDRRLQRFERSPAAIFAPRSLEIKRSESSQDGVHRHSGQPLTGGADGAEFEAVPVKAKGRVRFAIAGSLGGIPAECGHRVHQAGQENRTGDSPVRICL